MDDGEERYQHEPFDGLSPDKIYERRWAATLLENVVGQLRAEYAVIHKAELFEGLKASVWGEAPEDGYQALAAKLNLSEGALRVAGQAVEEGAGGRILRAIAVQRVEQEIRVEGNHQRAGRRFTSSCAGFVGE